jgi:hypothetical protein
MSGRLAIGVVGALVAIGAAAAAVAACDDANVHILSAEQYNPQYACIGPLAGVDVVQGASTGDNCAPTCLTATVPLQDGGAQAFVYVTTTCPPYPTDYTSESAAQASGPSDLCTGAFAAYTADAACPPACTDGGPDVCIPAGDDGGGTGSEGGGTADASGGESGEGGDAGGADDGEGGDAGAE